MLYLFKYMYASTHEHTQTHTRHTTVKWATKMSNHTFVHFSGLKAQLKDMMTRDLWALFNSVGIIVYFICMLTFNRK